MRVAFVLLCFLQLAALANSMESKAQRCCCCVVQSWDNPIDPRDLRELAPQSLDEQVACDKRIDECDKHARRKYADGFASSWPKPLAPENKCTPEFCETSPDAKGARAAAARKRRISRGSLSAVPSAGVEQKPTTPVASSLTDATSGAEQERHGLKSKDGTSISRSRTRSHHKSHHKDKVEDKGITVAEPYSPGQTTLKLQRSLSGSRGRGGITKLVVMGDLHGDFEAAKQLFARAGFLDDKGNFRPPRHQAIALLGDYHDRGNQDRELFRFLNAARAAYPDQLYLLMGNHEQLMLEGDLSYSTSYHSDLMTLTAEQTDKLSELQALLTCEGKTNQAFRNLPALLLVGTTLIAHAGPSLEWTEFLQKQDTTVVGPKLTRAYNDLLAADLKQQCQYYSSQFPALPKDWKGNVPQSFAATAGSSGYGYCPDASPVWFRGFSMAKKDDDKYGELCCAEMAEDKAVYSPDERFGKGMCEGGHSTLSDSVCQAAHKVLQHFQADRMILAHSIQEKGIRHMCKGMLIFVDVALSYAYRDQGGAPPRQFVTLEKGSPPIVHKFSDTMKPEEPKPLARADNVEDLGDISCAKSSEQFAAPEDWCTGKPGRNRAEKEQQQTKPSKTPHRHHRRK